jgi:hypothetical protein
MASQDAADRRAQRVPKLAGSPGRHQKGNAPSDFLARADSARLLYGGSANPFIERAIGKPLNQPSESAEFAQLQRR